MTYSKTCSRCGVEKTGGEFNKRAANRDGLRCTCRSCESEQRRAAYRANPERARQHSRDFYRRNRKEVLEGLAQRRASDPSVRERERERYWRNPEATRAKNRRKYAANREHINQQQREWRAANRERCRERERNYYEKHRSKILARARLANAIKHGGLIRPSRCERCSTECTPEGHHHDYSKPLDVEWLCKRCHENHHHGLS